MGGVCLNRVCIPSKALLHITKVMDEAASLSKAGVTFGKPKIDIDTIRQHKDKIVSQLNNGIAGMAKARKVDFLKGKAMFSSNSEVEVLNGKKILAVRVPEHEISFAFRCKTLNGAV